jgi:Ca2+-binding EF-hand superfamily protein
MSDLRYQINAHNIDLCKVLASLGYKSGKTELSKKKFFEFLKIISPSIVQETSDYIFSKVDIDKNGTISINEIEQTMNENSIMISVINKTIPGFPPSDDNS